MSCAELNSIDRGRGQLPLVPRDLHARVGRGRLAESVIASAIALKVVFAGFAQRFFGATEVCGAGPMQITVRRALADILARLAYFRRGPLHSSSAFLKDGVGPKITTSILGRKPGLPTPLAGRAV